MGVDKRTLENDTWLKELNLEGFIKEFSTIFDLYDKGEYEELHEIHEWGFNTAKRMKNCGIDRGDFDNYSLEKYNLDIQYADIYGWLELVEEKRCEYVCTKVALKLKRLQSEIIGKNLTSEHLNQIRDLNKTRITWEIDWDDLERCTDDLMSEMFIEILNAYNL